MEDIIVRKTISGLRHQTYYWVFEKMKTKKGCEAYFENGCHLGEEKAASG